MTNKHDIVIVGAGAAGAVLAARLSADPACSVLLLEAGPDFNGLDRLPLSLRVDTDRVADDPDYLWSYDATLSPEKTDKPFIVRGRVVGGSSAVNNSVFLRGLPEDYDAWRSDVWSWKSVLPFFTKLETDLNNHDDFHGTDGPIPVWRHPRATWTAPQEAFYEAAVSLGFPPVADLNAPTGGGVGSVPMNNHQGIRVSASLAYLQPIRHRPNFAIKADSVAQRIIFNNTRAVGVEGRGAAGPFLVEAEEIIVSAGTFGSPHLLLLSGIGPERDLRRAGVRVVQDLRGVGQNLRCHPGVVVDVRLADGFSTAKGDPRIQTTLTYTARNSSDRNDMQILPLPIGDVMRFSCGVRLPASVGTVTLLTADPEMQPNIDYNYLAPWDRDRLYEGVQIVLKLLKQPSLRRIVAQVLEPGPEDVSTRIALHRWIGQTISTAHHACGTCKLGSASDEFAVVGDDCRVHGVESLRVVDLSIAPQQIRSGTYPTALMIGERVADLIRGTPPVACG